MKIRCHLLVAALTIAGGTWILPIHAQSAFTWNGGGTDGNWTTGANWGGTAPGSPQAFLNFNGSARTTNTNNFSAGSGGFQIYFKSGANAFNLYGNGINFFDFGSVDPNIQNEGAFTNQTINFPITNANTHVLGSVRILNINLNTGTAQGPLTFNGPIGTPADSLARALNVSGSNTVTFNGAISDGGSGSAMGLTQLGTGTTVLTASNTYIGQTTVNAGTLSVSGGNIASGSFVKVNTGGILSVSAAGRINGNVQIATNTTAVQNASISGTIVGNLTIDAGSTNVTPNASGLYTSPASGFVQANLSASISSGGFITNYGVLNLTGASALTLGTIVGPGSDATGNLGGIQDNNTNSKTLTLGNGSAFAYYKPAGGIPGTTLQIAGNGAAFIKWFGYNDAANIVPYTNTLNGGTWTFANVGQNNSSQHYIGNLTVSNGAVVLVTNNINYAHGTWNIVSNSSVTFSQAGKSLQPGHAASNIGLNVNVRNNGSLYLGASGLILGYAAGTGQANTAAESNSLNINTGGLVVVTNSLTVGGGSANQASETNTVNLTGGKLLITGTLAVGSVNNIITNATPWNPVAPVNVFNWSGGQLSAATINTSNGLVIIGVTNSTPTTFFVTNPAVFNSGNISSTAITNNAGTLAPGDLGTSGKTTINGSYVQTAGGTLDVDLNGLTAASAFQTASAYDLLVVTNAASLGGNLIVRTNGIATITATSSFTILTAAGGVSGSFNNLLAGNRVAISGNSNFSFQVITTATAVILTNLQQNSPTVSVSPTSTNISYGNSVTLNTTASGISPLSYQWYDNTTNAIGGATNPTLTLTTPAVAASGNYTVVVTNLYGSAAAVAAVTVTPVASSVGLASPVNPSGYLGAVSFNATVLTDATGSVKFSANGTPFSTNVVSGGGATSAGISLLPRGTNTITVVYSGDGNYFGASNSLAQVVTNHLPVTGNVTLTRNAGIYSFLIPISNLLTNTSDADGDAVTFAGAGVSTNGITLAVLGGTYLGYFNTNNVNDRFTFSIADGFGGTNTGSVSIIINQSVTGQMTGQINSFSNNVASLTFHGIPGFSYITERTTDLTIWVNVGTNTAAFDGVINVNDTFGDLGGTPPPSAYYRLKYNP